MKQRILITVKTYPTLSKRYGELVCTAGLREDGSWVRIYPVPFRRLNDYLQYRKWVWVELGLVRNTKDPRPESYRPTDLDGMRVLEDMPPGKGWDSRKGIVLRKASVYDDIGRLIELANRENALSLAVFKPASILDLLVEETDREWDKDTIDILKTEASQGDLFAPPEEVGAEFRVVKKVPYRFSYRFRDAVGRESTLMIEDWEIGQLYWNCLKQAGGNESSAVALVKGKYLTEFTAKRDVSLFLGTTRQYHGWASNPFVIVGVFYPPLARQMALDLR